MTREMTPVEEKILELIFRDKVITDILVDALLPKITNWNEDTIHELKPETVYNIARDTLKCNLNRLLNK